MKRKGGVSGKTSPDSDTAGSDLRSPTFSNQVLQAEDVWIAATYGSRDLDPIRSVRENRDMLEIKKNRRRR